MEVSQVHSEELCSGSFSCEFLRLWDFRGLTFSIVAAMRGKPSSRGALENTEHPCVHAAASAV